MQQRSPGVLCVERPPACYCAERRSSHLVCTPDWWDLQNSSCHRSNKTCAAGVQDNRSAHMKASALLGKLIVVVSFFFDVSKLGYLEQSVTTVLGYPTSVDVCVVTNAPEKLGRVFETWEVSSENLWVCKESWAADADDHKYALLWRHRSVLAAAAAGVLVCAWPPSQHGCNSRVTCCERKAHGI